MNSPAVSLNGIFEEKVNEWEFIQSDQVKSTTSTACIEFFVLGYSPKVRLQRFAKLRLRRSGIASAFSDRNLPLKTLIIKPFDKNKNLLPKPKVKKKPRRIK